jgi:hypothetical protein
MVPISMMAKFSCTLSQTNPSGISPTVPTVLTGPLRWTQSVAHKIFRICCIPEFFGSMESPTFFRLLVNHGKLIDEFLHAVASGQELESGPSRASTVVQRRTFFSTRKGTASQTSGVGLISTRIQTRSHRKCGAQILLSIKNCSAPCWPSLYCRATLLRVLSRINTSPSFWNTSIPPSRTA